MESSEIYAEVMQKNSAQTIGVILDQLDRIRDAITTVNTENFSSFLDARDLNTSLTAIAQGLSSFALTTEMAAALSLEREQ